MQSDKLPKMPEPVYRRCVTVREGVDLYPLFTFDQMRDYALAVRKAALQEVRAELKRSYDEADQTYKGSYGDGQATAFDVMEGWVERLMEQDA